MSVILLSKSFFELRYAYLKLRYDDLHIEDTSNNEQLFLLNV